MQVSIETTGALERRMEVSVPRERIEQAIDERLKRVSRTAKLKGFRPGKVPFKVVKQQFGAQVRQEVALRPDAVELRRGGDAGEAQSGGRPAHRAAVGRSRRGSALPRDLRGVPRDRAQGRRGHRRRARPVGRGRPTPTWTRWCANLREQRPRFDVVERESPRGRPRHDGLRGRWSTARRSRAARATTWRVLLGGGRMLKDFEAGITGLKADERRQVSVPYPADYHNPALAGKAASFDVHVKKVEERAPAGARRRVLPRVRRARGRHRAAAPRGARQHGARARRQRPRAAQAAAARRPAQGQPRRGAAELRRRRRCAKCRSRRRAAWARRTPRSCRPPTRSSSRPAAASRSGC